MSLLNKIKETQEEIEDTPAGDDAAPQPEKKEPPAAKEEPEEAPAARDPGGKFRSKEKPAEAEKPKAPPAPADEERPDNAAMAKMRRDLAAAQRRADDADRRWQDAERARTAPPAAEPAKPAAATDPEPDKNNDPEAHLRWEVRQAQNNLKGLSEWKADREAKDAETAKEQGRERALNAATEEFLQYEGRFAAKTPDYEHASKFVLQHIGNSIRTLYPHLEGAALNKAIQVEILRKAGQGQKAGYDPIEYLYEQAKVWGYKEPAPAAEDPAPRANEKPAKPSIRDIAANKKKSASSMAPGGKSASGVIDKGALLQKGFTLGEFSRLTPGQLKDLESQREF